MWDVAVRQIGVLSHGEWGKDWIIIGELVPGTFVGADTFAGRP